MRKSVRILLGLCGLLIMAVVVAAASTIDIHAAGAAVVENSRFLALGPVAIVTSTITPDIIQDLKVKFGHIKTITVVAEADEYDIDHLSFEDLLFLKSLGADTGVLRNKNLAIGERMFVIEKVLDKKDLTDEQRAKIIKVASGIVVSPGEKYQFLVRRPDKGLIKMLLPLAKEGQIDEFADKAIKNLVVGGDLDSLEDGIVYMGVVSQLQSMISPASSFLAKA